MTQNNDSSRPTNDEEMPKGFTRIGGNVDIDGWYKPIPGEVVSGTIVHQFTIKGTQKGKKRFDDRDVAVVELDREAMAIGDDQKELVLQPGQHIGVGIRHTIRDITLYENGSQLWLKAIKEDDIGNNQTMWIFECGLQGRKKRQPLPVEQRPRSNGRREEDDDFDSRFF